jgi:hypothetical protein
MTRHAAERTLWLATLSFAAATGWSAVNGRRPPAAPSRPPGSQPVALAAPPESALTWSRAAAARNPFRFERAPASVRFGEATDTVAAAPPVSRPVFTLLGTIGGPPWQGVISGFPGRAGGVVVRSGQAVDSFVVRSVTRDSAVISGMDTVWRLPVRRPWR